MTQRDKLEAEAWAIIEPFVEEWLDRAGPRFAAFRNWAVGQVLWDENLSDEQVEEAVAVDGPGDMGIDAWYLANDEARRVLYLVQSKDTRATKGDLDKLAKGFLDLFHPTNSLNANTEVRTRAAELQPHLDDDFTIEFHLVTSKLVAKNLRTDGEPLSNEDISFLGRTFPTVSYVHDVESLAGNLRVIQEHPITAHFQIGQGEYFGYQTNSNYRTVSAAIRADALARLFHQNRLNLFRLNPRYFLTTKSVVNREILETLSGEDPDNFYLYNNGVTATCSAINVSDGGTDSILELHDFQIVNGCQTTATIYEKWRRAGGTGNLDAVRVPIRIIETQAAKQMAEQIARTTNRQNQMKQEDFRSGDKLHEKLQAEFDMLTPRWFYEYKRGTWNTDFRTAAAKYPYVGEPFAPRRIQMKDLAQACLAFQGRPDDSVDRISSYFASEERYRQVFPTTSKAQQLLLPYVLFLKADEIAKGEREEYAWSTSYLRYPTVACVSRALRYLTDAPTSYFGSEASAEIMSKLDEWAPKLFPVVFEELAKSVEKEAQSGRGVRAVVRRRDWLDEAYDAVQFKIDATLDAERQAADSIGADPNTIGLRSVLPVIV